MEGQELEQRIQKRWRPRGANAEKGRRWVGVFLLVIGGLFLARASGVNFPTWFFTWPVLLIGIGITLGIKHGFRNAGWIFPILIGGVFLADRLSPDFNLRPYLWPLILIAVGLFIIFRPRAGRCDRHGAADDSTDQDAVVAEDTSAETSSDTFNDRKDNIDVTAIFGGIKKNVLSKTFRGGDIVAFMGGAEINLTKADVNGKAVIDCFNMFGGTKLIIPADWEVQSDVVAIFGGVDDKRPPASGTGPSKILYLDGTCLFGGIEIKSF